jgi:hypothetical protein
VGQVGGKSWLRCVERLSRADDRRREYRDGVVLLSAKMAERMLSSVGGEGGWDGDDGMMG